ncbi:unnamed protein product [Rotaria socialis]|uniref:Uncharacterized protein n=1 Tax=Rotaria socialis TaxID=392032 RepID=A0A820SZC3_9BILA|nr:unnamed protein product [Rotaria socialis]CAF4457596.1 unnamed protein product [Rotaria socialis]CAF4601105.1 unnamed protein product [Rotaria socialis]
MAARRGMGKDFIVIWVDRNIDPSNEDCQNTLTQLRHVANEIQECSTAEQCITRQYLVPRIHGMPQLDTIYIYCGNKELHKAWADKWTKINGVHTSIKPICEALHVAVKQYNQDNIHVSIIVLGSLSNLMGFDRNPMGSDRFRSDPIVGLIDLGTYWECRLASSPELFPYYVSCNWYRLSLQVNFTSLPDWGSNWHTLYHDTHPQNIHKIVENGLFVRQCQHGFLELYMSPSIAYCSHPSTHLLNYNWETFLYYNSSCFIV